MLFVVGYTQCTHNTLDSVDEYIFAEVLFDAIRLLACVHITADPCACGAFIPCAQLKQIKRPNIKITCGHPPTTMEHYHSKVYKARSNMIFLFGVQVIWRKRLGAFCLYQVLQQDHHCSDPDYSLRRCPHHHHVKSFVHDWCIHDTVDSVGVVTFLWFAWIFFDAMRLVACVAVHLCPCDLHTLCR